MVQMTCRIILFLFMVYRALCGGSFKLELLNFKNDRGLMNDNTCCSGQFINNDCTDQCKTFFRICIMHYQRNITTDNCLYGEYTTVVLGNNSFAFPKIQDGFTNPLSFQMDFEWKGDFSLVIQAYHEVSASSGLGQQLITQVNGSSTILSLDGWKNQTWTDTQRRSIQFRYKFECDATYYGPTCNKICLPRNDELGHFECGLNGERVCRQGWTGEYCDKAICLEGCHPTNGHCSRPNECSCSPGWQGRYCNECIAYPECKNGYCSKPYECVCYEGWGGLFCNQDLNYCTNNKPCRNGGTCTNTGEGSYTCACPIGFGGKDCENEIDNCKLQPCLNAGVCKDVGNDFVCECPEGFTGPRCQTRSSRCESNPCVNSGTCVPVGAVSYRCICAAGYLGVNCMEQKNECESRPCLNGGSCINRVNGFTCNCPPGFSGKSCEINIDECAGQNPCLNGGVCEDRANNFKCRCPAGYIGSLCEINVDDCATRPCANGGTCMDKMNDFECLCAPGYTGRMCSDQINECSSHPCNNGGTCVDLINGFECHCIKGFEGPTCLYASGQSPRTTSSATTTTTASHATNSTSATQMSNDQNNNPVSPKAVVDAGQPSASVELSQLQFIVIVCLGCGIPMVLLTILAVCLLYRRHQKKRLTKASVETQQNECNNRINNDITNIPSMKTKNNDAEYLERRASVPPNMSSPYSLDLRNETASQPEKYVNKNLLKDNLCKNTSNLAKCVADSKYNSYKGNSNSYSQSLSQSDSASSSFSSTTETMKDCTLSTESSVVYSHPTHIEPQSLCSEVGLHSYSARPNQPSNQEILTARASINSSHASRKDSLYFDKQFSDSTLV